MATSIQSAVRLPSPEPGDVPVNLLSSRKRSPISRSPSPRRRPLPPRRGSDSESQSPPRRLDEPLPRDVDRARAMERARQLEMRQKKQSETARPLTEEQKQASAKAEYDRLLNMRSGGTYIPPARLRALQAQITDKTSKEYQRMAWEALKKSINGLINKINVSNIKHIVPELFNENLIRGRGLFCRSIMKAQAASLPFTPIYAAMAAIVNTKLPQVGELLINRLIIQFRKAFKRNDKSVCHSSTTFMAHLINQQVAHEMLAAQILLLLLHKPTDDSVEIAVGLMKEVGQHIEEMNSQIALAVYDQFRSILHEADIDKRVQYMIEVLFQIRKDKYKDNLAIREELDLVEEEDQITHRQGLDDQVGTEDGLNIFKFDAEWETNEEAYKKLKAEILGEESGSEDGEDDEDASDESSEDEHENVETAMEIKDQSNQDLVNLRRSIYLTIMSSGGFEEACHKLMRINLPAGREEELPSMIIECCSQERTYNKFFGMVGERFCKLNRLWKELFEEFFAKYYDTIHRYETNRLRIIAQFFSYQLASDAIGWHVLSVVHLNEEETTSSSRIFIKILMEELAQSMGNKTLAERLKTDELQPALAGIFPTDNPKNTRFSINFFTAIGMGMLTEGMREWLKNLPKPAPVALPAKSPTPSSRSRSESVSSYSSRSSGSSRSRSRSTRPRQNRGRGYTRSMTPRDGRSRTRSVSASRSPLPKKGSRRHDTASPSRSPVRRRGSRPADSRSPQPKSKRRLSDSASVSPQGRRDNKSGRHNRSVSRSPPRRRRHSLTHSRSRSPPRRTNGTRNRSPSYSRSRSPPVRRRGRSRTRTASPLTRNGKPASRSTPRERDESSRSYSSRSPTPPRRARGASPSRKRRRNTSSPRTSRSRSPPRRKESNPKPSGSSSSTRPSNAKPTSKSVEEDLDNIHPSRRGLMGGPRARARASDFM